jgi:hypothetical protein
VAFAKIRIDLPQSAGLGFVDSLRAKMVEQVTAQWNVWYGILQTYAEVHGNCKVPSAYELPDGYRLGRWVGTQRMLRNTISPERRANLESLPGWAWDAAVDAWDVGFSHLSEYGIENGHYMVPSAYELPDGYKLGRWVNIQRVRREQMPPERRVRLEKLSGWSWGKVRRKIGTRVDAWESAFGHLSEYVAVNGNCLVPSAYVLSDGYKLGSWVTNQRQLFGKMPPERQARLEALSGWAWDQHEVSWQVGFLRLSEYAGVNGNCLVPSDYVLPDGYKLGSWVRVQRMLLEKMPPERRERLEALSGWAWGAKSQGGWESGFRNLSEYAGVNGNCLVQSTYVLPDGYKLGSWVATQRTRKNVLSQDKQARLDALPGWVWDARSYAWEVGFGHLGEYAAVNGNCLVHQKCEFPSGFKLGTWVAAQRALGEKMSPQRHARLNALPGWTWKVSK